MKSNFDFLKNIDENLWSAIVDAEKLFRDEYISQCCVQIRVFAEKTAKKVLKDYPPESTFDDIINTLKDKIQTERDREFVEDLFFIKREGNKCAHGEETTISATLEAIKRAFEISIYYGNSLKGGSKLDKLQFDETLLVTGKPLSEEKLVDKYVKLAEAQQEELLNSKQLGFDSNVEKETPEGFRDENYIQKPSKKKKELTPTQKRIKEKVKLAKKNIKENINKTVKKNEKPIKKAPEKTSKKTKKSSSKKKKQNKNSLKYVLFILFVIISLYFLTKMLFFY